MRLFNISAVCATAITLFACAPSQPAPDGMTNVSADGLQPTLVKQKQAPDSYSFKQIATARNNLKQSGLHKRALRDEYRETPFDLMKEVLPDVVIVERPIVVKENTTFDGAGKLYVWVGDGDCSQKEAMPPMFLVRENSTVENLFMYNAPDGIHLRGSNTTVNNVVNLDVCEDAVSTDFYDYENIAVTNSVFYHCEDKGLQFNGGTNILVQSNKFLNCAQPVRIPKAAKYSALDNQMTGVGDYYYLRAKK